MQSQDLEYHDDTPSDPRNIDSPQLEPENNGEWTNEAGDFDALADPEERRVVFAALDSFRQYRKTTHHNTTHRRRQNLYALPHAHWSLLATAPFSLLDTLNLVDDAIDANADIADEILALALQAFNLPADPEKSSPLNWHNTATPNDLNKAHSTLRQLYRDWSAEGVAAEVHAITTAVLSDLNTSFSSRSASILVPGAGLARLLFNLAHAGHNVEGNEISYHQLLASNWILNNTQRANQFPLYPFATTFTNLRSRTQQLRQVLIPDIHPTTALAEKAADGHCVGEMGMAAGDFIVVYSRPEYAQRFDTVVSVFFIDTAPNLIRYIETMRQCLKAGGMWINIGPLLWHFDDRVVGRQEKSPHVPKEHRGGGTGIAEPGSFELSDEEVVVLLERFGFKIEKHDVMEAGVGYIQDPESLLQNLYRPSHWVARKM